MLLDSDVNYSRLGGFLNVFPDDMFTSFLPLCFDVLDVALCSLFHSFSNMLHILKRPYVCARLNVLRLFSLQLFADQPPELIWIQH